MECSSNVVHLRTCADSCIALRDLILYLSRNGDLQRGVAASGDGEGGGGGGEMQLLRDYSTLGSEVNSLVRSNWSISIVRGREHCS